MAQALLGGRGDTPRGRDVTIEHWFLTPEERGNRATTIDRRRDDGRAWTEGNLVEPLVHGASYYPRLLAALRALRKGDLVGISEWRGDTD